MNWEIQYIYRWLKLLTHYHVQRNKKVVSLCITANPTENVKTLHLSTFQPRLHAAATPLSRSYLCWHNRQPIMALNNGLAEGKQRLCLCLSVCCWWSLGDGSPGRHSHSSPAMCYFSELKRLGPMMNTWPHDKISTGQTHMGHCLSLFSVLAHSQRDPSLCECLAMCLLLTLLLRVSCFVMFKQDAAFFLVFMRLTC